MQQQKQKKIPVRRCVGCNAQRPKRELVRVVLARADAWINPPRPQDNPFRSFFTILRCVFELFWLTWKTRRSQRNRATVAKTAQEDGTL